MYYLKFKNYKNFHSKYLQAENQTFHFLLNSTCVANFYFLKDFYNKLKL